MKGAGYAGNVIDRFINSAGAKLAGPTSVLEGPGAGNEWDGRARGGDDIEALFLLPRRLFRCLQLLSMHGFFCQSSFLST